MPRDLDDTSQQTHRQHVRLTGKLLGVVDQEEYFARQEVERNRKLAEKRQSELLAEQLERERAIHYMKCPKCGVQLDEVAFGDVCVDKCFSCQGLWLDKGELDLIRKKEGGLMGRMLRVFG